MKRTGFQFSVGRRGVLGGVLALFLGLLCCAGGAYSAALTTGADFLLTIPSARPEGMGEAFSALVDDVTAFSFNPSGLANIHRPEVGYSHQDFASDIGFDFIGAAFPLEDLGVVGVGFQGLGVSPFNSTASSLVPLGSAEDLAFMGGWGKSFGDLNVGASGKFISRKVGTVSGTDVGFDLGLSYRVIPRLTLALGVLNMGPDIQLGSFQPLPTVMNVGGMFQALRETDFSLGLATEAQLNLPTQTQRFSVGGEGWYRDTFALRAGYLFSSIEEGVSLGAGVRVSFMEIDYAYQPYAVLGTTHRFSGVFRWGAPAMTGLEAPKNLRIQKSGQTATVYWDKGDGSVEAYEIRVKVLDGSNREFIKTSVEPLCILTNCEPGKIYGVSIHSIGKDGTQSPYASEISFQ